MDTLHAVAKSAPPRLAESGDALFDALVELGRGTASRFGVLTPTVRIVGMGDFVVREGRSVERMRAGALVTERIAGRALDRFHDALDGDRALVLLETPPRFDAVRTSLQVLHLPAHFPVDIPEWAWRTPGVL